MARRINKQIAAFFDAEVEAMRRKGDDYLKPGFVDRRPQPASARECYTKADDLVQLKRKLLATLASPSQEKTMSEQTHDTTDDVKEPAPPVEQPSGDAQPSPQGDGDSGPTQSTADENEG